MSKERVVPTLFAIASAAVLTGCIPATAHVRVTGDPRDAFTCAERTLSMRGYDIVDSDDKAGTIRAERYPAAVHMRMRDERQRVFISIGHGASPMMYVRGDVMGATDSGPGSGMMRGPSPIPPRQIYDDVDAIARNCGGDDRASG
jgi:hypothetical protein